MRVIDLSSAAEAATVVPALPPGTAVCLGAFDGMHRGHQGLIARARALGREVAVVTFEPRPADVLTPNRAPPRLQSPGQREHVCRELGVDTLVVLRFDRSVAKLSPAAFVEQFLVRGLRPAMVVVGYDFHFGAQRAGGPVVLRELLGAAGIGVSIVDKIELDPSERSSVGEALAGEKLGSTAIRELIGAGEVERASELLGRLYAVAGVVEHGAARGRNLGFPTANVRTDLLLPARGVYACLLSLLDDRGARELRWWPAVANLGTNPTFVAEPDVSESLEVHAFDVDLGEQLYGRAVEVAFVARLRDEQRFPGVDALREAIARDIARARELLDPATAERRHAQRVAAEPSRVAAEPIGADRQAGGER
jgi:riboflavin kinase/FMN adenylyltransferase